MNKYRPVKSSIFLLEIILNIIFFAITATICVQLFFKAHMLSNHAQLLHNAVSSCSSIAEIYQSGRNGKELVLSLYPNAIELNSTILFYFDKNYTPCNEIDSTYRAILEYEKQKSTAKISFFSKGSTEEIYSFTFSSYVPQTPNERKEGLTL